MEGLNGHGSHEAWLRLGNPTRMEEQVREARNASQRTRDQLHYSDHLSSHPPSVLMLSSEGSHGLMSFTVSQRCQEIGIEWRGGDAVVVLPMVTLVITVGLLAARGPLRRSLRIQLTEPLAEE
jgi:hypothetical protein